MKYFYGEYDGQPFPTPDKLFNFDQLMNFIMQYGEQALKAMQCAADIIRCLPPGLAAIDPKPAMAPSMAAAPSSFASIETGFGSDRRALARRRPLRDI